jgi:hypothetical protein
MSTPATSARKRQGFAWVAIVLAAAVGFKFGYDFGFELDGRWLAWFTGLNGALLCSLLADGAVGRLEGWKAGRGPAKPD